jgi:hypothetical protein
MSVLDMTNDLHKIQYIHLYEEKRQHLLAHRRALAQVEGMRAVNNHIEEYGVIKSNLFELGLQCGLTPTEISKDVKAILTLATKEERKSNTKAFGSSRSSSSSKKSKKKSMSHGGPLNNSVR